MDDRDIVLSIFGIVEVFLKMRLPDKYASSPFVVMYLVVTRALLHLSGGKVESNLYGQFLLFRRLQVMLGDGLRVLKHHRRISKKACSRVIRFVPDFGGALVWDKPVRQPGAKVSRIPLEDITQVELEVRPKPTGDFCCGRMDDHFRGFVVYVSNS